MNVKELFNIIDGNEQIAIDTGNKIIFDKSDFKAYEYSEVINISTRSLLVPRITMIDYFDINELYVLIKIKE